MGGRGKREHTLHIPPYPNGMDRGKGKEGDTWHVLTNQPTPPWEREKREILTPALLFQPYDSTAREGNEKQKTRNHPSPHEQLLMGWIIGWMEKDERGKKGKRDRGPCHSLHSKPMIPPLTWGKKKSLVSRVAPTCHPTIIAIEGKEEGGNCLHNVSLFCQKEGGA